MISVIIFYNLIALNGVKFFTDDSFHPLNMNTMLICVAYIKKIPVIIINTYIHIHKQVHLLHTHFV